MNENNIYLYERLEKETIMRNLGRGNTPCDPNNPQNMSEIETQNNILNHGDIDVALVASHDYSDRYELSISNNGDWIKKHIKFILTFKFNI